MTGRLMAERPRRWSVVVRAIVIYLFVAWLLVRFVKGQDTGQGLSGIQSVALLAGLPIAILLASRLARRNGGIAARVWGSVAVAVGAAAVVPLVFLQAPQHEERATEIVLTPALAEPTVLADAHLPVSGEGLRLRIRGLSVTEGEDQVGHFAGREAEILLLTSLDHDGATDELVVVVQLLVSDDGAEIWRAEYRGDPKDLVAVRRLLIRALTEAMSLTNEGLSGGQIV